MKTLTELKELIDYRQTDEHFTGFLIQLAQRGMITMKEGDIRGGEIDDALFNSIAGLYGVDVTPDEPDILTTGCPEHPLY